MESYHHVHGPRSIKAHTHPAISICDVSNRAVLLVAALLDGQDEFVHEEQLVVRRALCNGLCGYVESCKDAIEGVQWE